MDLAFRALDADGRVGAAVAVDVGGHAETCQGDAVRETAGCGGGEGQDHGCRLVGAGGGVFGHRADDFWRFAGGRGLGMVEGLEDPGYSVDADCM